MRIYLIGCEVILRELCDAIARSPHQVDVRFLTKGLHDQGAKAMRVKIQEMIDDAPAGYDRVALGYGLCGNGIAGLTARDVPVVVPRVHDCITLLMGSRGGFADYFQAHPGTYYRSMGWLERGSDLEPIVRTQIGGGQSLDELIERYGEENGRFLFEEFTRYQRAYSQLTYIANGLEPDDHFENEAKAEAARRGWRFETIPGHLGLFRRLLNGPWEPPDFLEVPPGHTIEVRHDDLLIAARRADS